jgi:hypothetical protein
MKRFLNYLPSRLYSFRVVEPEVSRSFMPVYIAMTIMGVLSTIVVFVTRDISYTASEDKYLIYTSWMRLLAPVGIALLVWMYVRVQVATDSPRMLLRYASIPEKYITSLLNDDEASVVVSKLAGEERGDMFNWIDVIDWHIKAQEIKKAVSHISDRDEAARAAGLLSIGFNIDDIDEFGAKQFYPHLAMGFSRKKTLFAVRAGIDADLAKSFFQGGMGHTMSLKVAA